MAGRVFAEDKKGLEALVGIRAAAHIQSGQTNKFESYRDMDLIALDLPFAAGTRSVSERIIICLKKDTLSVIFKNELASSAFGIKPQGHTPEEELCSFFSELLEHDLERMNDFEEEITDMEDHLLKNNKTDCVGSIIGYRKRLLGLKRYYEQFEQVFDGLLENRNGLISEEGLELLRLLDKRTDRLLAHINNLRDYVTQLREAYQAQTDIEQNNLMKIFTVVTTVFLPLTLIAGWYGMNLKMPEYSWDMGYPFVIVLSVLVVTVMIVFFKKKKWF